MKQVLDFRLIALGLLAYLAFLVATFPADRAYAHWMASSQPPKGLALDGISGSVWSGKANQARIQGTSLDGVEWRLHPWSLLTGKVALSWRLQVPNNSNEVGFGQGTTAFGLDGSIAFSELEARLPAIFVAELAKAGAVRPTGSVSVNLDDVLWNGQTLESATGRVVWHSAGVNIFKPLELGDLVVNLETGPEGVKGVLADGGGPLVAEGLVTLSGEGKYQFNGAFGTRGGAGSQDLAQALNTLGRPGSDGKVRVNQQGTLAALGLVPAKPR